MAKRPLNQQESFELQQILHVATLESIMAARRWEPGQLLFHGGTSLHLVHGSPRHSEDLDFMVDQSIDVKKIAASVKLRMTGATWLPPGSRLDVIKVKADGRMGSFIVALTSDRFPETVKLKVELWGTPDHALRAIASRVEPVRLHVHQGATMGAYVQTVARTEVMADKLFALGGRAYLKARDIFDIHWLLENQPGRPTEVFEFTPRTEDVLRRFSIYDVGGREAWLDRARARCEELTTPETRQAILVDLRRWLPSVWPLDTEAVTDMATAARAALLAQIRIVKGLDPAALAEAVSAHATRPSVDPAGLSGLQDAPTVSEEIEPARRPRP